MLKSATCPPESLIALSTSTENPRAARGEGQQVLAGLRRKVSDRLRPARLHYATQLAVPLAQREYRPGAARRAGYRRAVPFPTTGGPPHVGATRDTLRRAV